LSEFTESKKFVNYVISKLGEGSIFPLVAGCFNKRFYKPPGFIAGMPDYNIPALNLFIEMKDINPGEVKKHKEKQEAIHELLRTQGQHVYTCFGYKKAREKFDYHYSIYKQTC